MEKVAEFNKDNCVKWMAGIGASTFCSKTRANDEEKSIINVSRTSPETQGKVRKSLRISL